MKRLYYFLFISAFFCAFTACSDSDTPAEEERQKQLTTDEIFLANRFAKDALDVYYLWNKEITSDMSKLDPYTNMDPIATVKEIRYKENNTEIDRWTILTDDYASMNSSMQGVSTTYGYNLMLGKFSNTGNYFFIITHVYANSPASNAGLKRGDVIIKLDGADITTDNYMNAFYNPTIKLTMGVYSEQGITQGGDISMKAVQMYCNPILCHQIFDINGKKVGYLAFDGFDITSIPDLLDICKEFKEEKVTELILDLRYNGGGYVFTENILASIFAPADAVNSGALYQKEIYNEEVTNTYRKNGIDTNTYFQTKHSATINGKKVSYDISGLNMSVDKIYGIISAGTASAAESLLVGLMPYLNVQTIGINSHGKYCSGILLDPDGLYKNPSDIIEDWGIYVMIGRYTDKNGNCPIMPNGFVPDIKVTDNPLEGIQLGDVNETMLHEALKAAGMQFPAATRSVLSYPDYDGQFISSRPMHGLRILNDLSE